MCADRRAKAAVNNVSYCSSLKIIVVIVRPVVACGRSEGGEPEVEVWEPGFGSVYREPHVCLQRVPDHWHQEQTKVRDQLGTPPQPTHLPWPPLPSTKSLITHIPLHNCPRTTAGTVYAFVIMTTLDPSLTLPPLRFFQWSSIFNFYVGLLFPFCICYSISVIVAQLLYPKWCYFVVYTFIICYYT